MSNDRHKALSSIQNTNLKIIFINRDNLSSWVLENSPLHPAYKYLSSVHKADYLRCYFMHNYGGAYSDIKVIDDSWSLSYKELLNSEYLINGYREVNCIETARGRGLIKDIWLALNFYKVIGNGAYICKPNTVFTKEWFEFNNLGNHQHPLINNDLELIVFPHKDFIKLWFLVPGGSMQSGFKLSINDKVRHTLVIP